MNNMKKKSEHEFDGNGVLCLKCFRSKMEHRVRNRKEHQFKNDGQGICQICGLPFQFHRVRKYESKSKEKCLEFHGFEEFCDKCGLPRSMHYKAIRDNSKGKKIGKKGDFNNWKIQDTSYKGKLFIGIDGEGIGKVNHKYVMLTATDENDDACYYVENINGLSSLDCLNFFISLPNISKCMFFSYAFGYDLTKILTDLPNQTIYLLMRPELRQRLDDSKGRGPAPVWWNGFALNLQGTKLTIQKGDKKIVIWDLFKFFQSKFVSALKDWGVGNNDLYDRMSAMKNKRSTFNKDELAEIRKYNREECCMMGQLARKLVNAHSDAGLELVSFYGAGSTGSAIMKKMGVNDYFGSHPDEMVIAIASAFFGGRFENSIIGMSPKTPVFNWDIASAYPYQLTFLPCLKHAKWEWIIDETKVDRYSLVNYTLPPPKYSHEYFDWQPFPFREENGNICYPYAIGNGWVWGQEYLAGKKYWPRVIYKGHWHLHRECDHKPFQDIPYYYRERIKIGKEGKGKVLKLGPNSCYGKLAQSVGKGAFTNWIWSGMVTSGCRAQLLELIGLHADRSSVLMVATDGSFSTEIVNPPIPLNTDTFGLIDPSTGKEKSALGAWEYGEYKKGLFCVRPGIYFPPNPTIDELKYVKGRGLGKNTVLENWEKIVRVWETYGTDRNIIVGKVTMFCGAKTSINRSKIGPFSYKYKRSERTTENSPAYGQWHSRPCELSLNPWPKRDPNPDKNGRLKCRSMEGLESTPYGKACLSPDTLECQAIEDMFYEQPDTYEMSDWM